MSQIDELIAEFCPDGVEFKAVASVVSTSSNIKWSNAGDETYSYIDLSSVDRTTRRIGKTATVDSNIAPSRAQQIVRTGDVIFATTRPAQMRWATIPAEYDGQIASTGYCVLRPNKSIILTNFLAHILGSDSFHQYIEANQVMGNYPAIPDARVRAYRIPVPPLEVQGEIVRILDQFTQLEAELEAELEARQKQYDHYRTVVLRPRNSWKSMLLGDIADIFDGPHATPKKTTSGPWYLSISSLKSGNIDLSASAHLAQDDLPLWTRRVAPRDGDTLFSYETRIGQAAYWDRSEAAALGRRMGLLRPKSTLVVPKFLAIAYLSPEFQLQIANRTVRGSTVDRISIADLPNWPISIPSIDEQQRIIKLLAQFDALVSDISTGLPAEISARRKQYEYYRDKLLSFEEVPG